MMLLVEKEVKVWCEIGRTGGDKGDVNVMNVDWDIVDDGCNGEVLGSGVTGEEGVGGDADEGDGVMNEGAESSNSLSPGRSLRTAMQSGKVYLAGSWMISVWILVDMLQEYLPSGEGKIILAGCAGYHYS